MTSRKPLGGAYFNPTPSFAVTTLNELRAAMSRIGPRGGAYLDYLLEGNYFEGKSVWVSSSDDTRLAYQRLLDAAPHLITESPFSSRFRREGIRVRGENPIRLSPIHSASAGHRACLDAHRSEVRTGKGRPVALFAGGPAAKIAALVCATQGESAPETLFFIDGAEQSNESGSASYEHINHANALSAEFDNSGMAILMTALSRAVLGERDPEVALRPEYRRVDLWPAGFALRDVPIYVQYEIHGLIQRAMRRFKRLNEHDKSRYASKISTRVLTYLESRTGASFRIASKEPRAYFLYMNQSQWQLAQHENSHLRKTLDLDIRGLTRDALVEGYGAAVLDAVCGGDVFPENGCIRHGFDRVVADALVRVGGVYQSRTRIREIYFALEDDTRMPAPRAEALLLEDLKSGATVFQPVDYIGLSLGPTATYHYHPDLAGGSVSRWMAKHLNLGLPVPYQTIATGVTMQVLFRITDKSRYRGLPFTGLKQTHFVEIGSNDEHVLVKLTSGGNIGLSVYSRSYAISALASLLRIVTPDSGLTFQDVVCAWPCARAVNGQNNGQVVRLADNCAVRFGEGGTGMSKMGSNAQTLLDLIGLHNTLPPEVSLDTADYRHTVLDQRLTLVKRLKNAECRSPS